MCLTFLLQDPEDSLVVLSGCGTSGRLAFLIAVKLVLRRKFHLFHVNNDFLCCMLCVYCVC